jgi:hypothetical protein
VIRAKSYFAKRDGPLQVWHCILVTMQATVGFSDRHPNRRFYKRLVLKPPADLGGRSVQRLLHG